MLAQEEARKIDRRSIDSIALLLGLIREEDGIGARVLNEHKVNKDDIVQYWETEKGIEIAPESREAYLPFTNLAKKILEYALRESLSLGHNYIGTEHILLAMVRVSESDAAQLLYTRFGLDETTIRNDVARLLGPSKPNPKSLHSAVLDVLQYFEYEYLTNLDARAIGKSFHVLAYRMAEVLEGPQLTLGLHKLLEAKDCMVRASLPKKDN